MTKFLLDLSGQRFGRITVVSFSGKDARRNRLWNCRCDCGTECVKRGSDLINGYVQSCSCLQREVAAKTIASMRPDQRGSRPRNGIRRTPTGVSWLSMIQRCFNPKTKAFAKYGAIGIVPCAFIKSSPANLADLIGERPNTSVSLDRIDGAKGYTCGECHECAEKGWELNVRWATSQQQSRNRKSNTPITINGVTHFARDWSLITGLCESTIRARYQYKKRKQFPTYENQEN